jgi:hypothetical protein
MKFNKYFSKIQSYFFDYDSNSDLIQRLANNNPDELKNPDLILTSFVVREYPKFNSKIKKKKGFSLNAKKLGNVLLSNMCLIEIGDISKLANTVKTQKIRVQAKLKNVLKLPKVLNSLKFKLGKEGKAGGGLFFEKITKTHPFSKIELSGFNTQEGVYKNVSFKFMEKPSIKNSKLNLLFITAERFLSISIGIGIVFYVIQQMDKYVTLDEETRKSLEEETRKSLDEEIHKHKYPQKDKEWEKWTKRLSLIKRSYIVFLSEIKYFWYLQKVSRMKRKFLFLLYLVLGITIPLGLYLYWRPILIWLFVELPESLVDLIQALYPHVQDENVVREFKKIIKKLAFYKKCSANRAIMERDVHERAKKIREEVHQALMKAALKKIQELDEDIIEL